MVWRSQQALRVCGTGAHPFQRLLGKFPVHSETGNDMFLYGALCVNAVPCQEDVFPACRYFSTEVSMGMSRRVYQQYAPVSKHIVGAPRRSNAVVFIEELLSEWSRRPSTR